MAKPKTAKISKMKVRCSSMGIPQAEPILKDNFIIKVRERLLFKFSMHSHACNFEFF